MIPDPRQAAVEHAVKIKALVKLAREIGLHEALAVLATADPAKTATATPRELASAGRVTRRRRVLDEIAELEGKGQERAAASIVARRHALDERDPVEVETLTNKFRRWRRIEKRASARLASPETS